MPKSKPSLLVDTTAAVAWIRHDAKVVELLADQDVGLPVIALGELLFGAQASRQPERNLARICDLMALCEILTVTERVAANYATLRTALTRTGRMIPANDLWIAAIAADAGAPLLGCDKHFAMLPDFDYREF